MEVPRGFTRCDECEGRGGQVHIHTIAVPEHAPGCMGETCERTCPVPVPQPVEEWEPHPSCGGSGLVPTEKLREDVAASLFRYVVGMDERATASNQTRATDAVLRKVAEHLKGSEA